MKYISKEFKSIRRADQYLNKLYNRYNYVRIISFPRFTESGKYIFEVK